MAGAGGPFSQPGGRNGFNRSDEPLSRQSLAEHATMVAHANQAHGVQLDDANPMLNLISNASRITMRGPRRIAWVTKIVRNIYDAMAEELAAAMGYGQEEANAKGVTEREMSSTILPERSFNQFALGITDSAKWSGELTGTLPAALFDAEDATAAYEDGLPLDIELVDFVSEVMTHKYGLKALVDQKIWDLLVTLQHHVDSIQSTPELSLFNDFLLQKRPSKELALHLHMRRRLQAQSEGVWLPQVGEGMLEILEHIDLGRATALLDELYGVKWLERANGVAARARTLSEQELPPAYRPYIKVMEQQAIQTQELHAKALIRLRSQCSESQELSAVAEAQPTKLGAAGSITTEGFQWITVVEFVNFVSVEHKLQEQRLQLHKWLINRFAIVDSNRDRFISCEDFVRLFSDVPNPYKFPTARELADFFTSTVASQGASDVQEMSFSLFSGTVWRYLLD